MLNLGGIDALTRAEGLLENSARRIAQGPPKADDFIDLIQAREQFAAGVKVAKTEDATNRHLLELLG